MTNGNTVSLVSVATTGAQSVTGALIDLNGTYQSTIGLNGGNIGFTGPVTLLGTTGVTTANSAISFSSTVSGAFGLTLNAAGVTLTNGNVSVLGAVGAIPLTSFTVTNGNTVSLVSVATTGDIGDGGVDRLERDLSIDDWVERREHRVYGASDAVGDDRSDDGELGDQLQFDGERSLWTDVERGRGNVDERERECPRGGGAMPIDFTVTNGNTVSLVSVATTGAQSVTGALID